MTSQPRAAGTLEAPASESSRRLASGGHLHGLVKEKLDLIVLLAGSLLLALPFIVLHHVNTVDGPSHVLGGLIIGKLRHVDVVQHYYTIAFSWVPNILMQYMFVVLTSVFSPTWAEKLLVVGYVFGFPLSFRYAIRSVDPTAGWLALGALPLTVNRPLVTGFYAFSYAMIGAVLAIGVAIRARGRWGIGNGTALALILVATYTLHPLPLAVAMVVIAAFTVIDTVVALGRREDRHGPGQVLRRSALGPALALAPATLMTLAFVASGGDGGHFARYRGAASLVGGLVSLSLPMTSYTGWEVVASLLTVVVLGLLIRATIRANNGTRVPLASLPYLAAVGVSIVLYFIVPDDLGADSVLSPRLALFVPLTLLLLCASVPLAGRTRRRIGLAFLAVTVLLVGIRLPTQVHDDRLVSEFLTTERVIPPGASLLEVRYASYGLLDPLSHEVSRVAADRHDVDLLNVESLGPNYQETLRPHLRRLSRKYLLSHPDLSGYLDAGGKVDFVLVVGLDHPAPGFPGAPPAAFRQVLSRRFTRVMVTGGGLVQVYRLRQSG